MVLAAMARRIKKALVDFISLVPRGANRLAVLLKEEKDGKATFDLDVLLKASSQFSTNGEIHAVVYAPEHRDAHGDIADSAVIKDAAYEYMRKGGLGVDLRHDGNTVGKDRAYVAESFIIQKGDERFAGMTDSAGTPVDVTGGWGSVIKILDPQLRADYLSGKWNGVSMGGQALYEIEKSDEDLPERVAAELLKMLTAKSNKDTPMTPEQLAALQKSINDSNTTLIAGITTAISALATSVGDLKKSLTPEKKEEPKAAAAKPPKFVGDRLCKEDVEKHQKKVALFELTKDLDMDTTEGITEYRERLEAFEADFGPVSDLKKAAPSNLSKSDDGETSDGTSDGTSDVAGTLTFSGLNKADTKNAQTGSKLGALINAQRGFKAAAR